MYLLAAASSEIALSDVNFEFRFQKELRSLAWYSWIVSTSRILGKFIEVETDHNNLKWMESSISPAIVRMRVFLQSYITHVRHIPGKSNGVADYLSRTFDSSADNATDLAAMFAAEDKATPATDDSDGGRFELLADALLYTD